MCGLWLRDLRTVKRKIHLPTLSPHSKHCRAEPNLLCTSHIWVLPRWWGWELLPGERLTHGLQGAEGLLTFQIPTHGIFSPCSLSFCLCCFPEAAPSSHLMRNFSSWFLGGVTSHTNHSVLLCLGIFDLLPSTGDEKSGAGWAMVSHSPSSHPRGPTRAGSPADESPQERRVAPAACGMMDNFIKLEVRTLSGFGESGPLILVSHQ